MLRIASLALLCLAACGGLAAANVFNPDYPPGPYGVTVGSTLANTALRGQLSASDSVGDIDYQLLRTWGNDHGIRYALLWNTASWCDSNVTSNLRLQAHWAADAHPGLVFVTVLDAGPETTGGAFGTCSSSNEPATQSPATDDDSSRWLSTFDIDFPVLHDCVSTVGGYCNITPQNVMQTYRASNGKKIGHVGIIVDLWTMKYLLDTTGGDLLAAWMTCYPGVDCLITQVEADYHAP